MYGLRLSRRSPATVEAGCLEKWRLCISAKGISKYFAIIWSFLVVVANLLIVSGWRWETDTLGNASLLFTNRNILELVEFFEDDSCFYLVFEKLCGGTALQTKLQPDLRSLKKQSWWNNHYSFYISQFPSLPAHPFRLHFNTHPKEEALWWKGSQSCCEGYCSSTKLLTH